MDKNKKASKAQVKENQEMLKNLADMVIEVERAVMQESTGHKMYTQEEIDKMFILNKKQAPPYIRGFERREGRGKEPVALIKVKGKTRDWFYIYATGGVASALHDRYFEVPAKPEETFQEMMTKKKNLEQLEERYSEPDKKLSQKEAIKRRYGQ